MLSNICNTAGESLYADTDPKNNYMPLKDDDYAVSEWRISNSGRLYFPVKNANRTSDFRNHRTGEALLPVQIYSDFIRRVRRIHYMQFIKFSLVLFILILALAVVMATLLILNTSLATIYATMMICIGMATLAILATIFKRPDIVTCDFGIIIDPFVRRDKLMQKYRAEFADHGIELSHCCLYLQVKEEPYFSLKIQSQRTIKSVDSFPVSLQKFPPIFLETTVPGDICIDEYTYHHSMIMPEEIWWMIKNVHTSILNNYSDFGQFPIFFTISLTRFSDVFIGSVRMQVLACCLILLTWLIAVIRARKQRFQDVIKIVNQTLATTTASRYHLTLDTSSLPLRPGHMSRRYQLVSVNQSIMDNLETQSGMEEGEYQTS